MAETKGKKREAARPAEKSVETRQLVVTLSVAKGDVVKVETIDGGGHRHEMPEKDFAALAGEDDLADLSAALEEAYAAGMSDAIDHEIDDDSVEDEDEDEEIRRTILREAAARKLLRRGVRRLVLRRTLRRGIQKKHAHSRHNGNGAHNVH